MSLTATATFQSLTATAQFRSVSVVGEDAIVKNSDDSYYETVAGGATLELADTIINVYVNGTLNQSITRPSMIDRTINIS
jgi:hypothetical protein